MSREDVRVATSRWNNARWRGEAHKDNVILTPPWLVERIRRDVLGTIDLDPATTTENPTGATRFVHLPEDGIMADWAGNVFVNPPWGRTLPLWVERAILAGGAGRVVMLIPARTDVRWFQRGLSACDNALLFGRRLDYIFNGQAKRVRGATGALFASALFGFGVSLEPLAELGTIVYPSPTSRTVSQGARQRIVCRHAPGSIPGTVPCTTILDALKDAGDDFALAARAAHESDHGHAAEAYELCAERVRSEFPRSVGA